MVKKTAKAAAPAKYVFAIGRRKTARAKIKLFSGTGKITVNSISYADYFPTLALQKKVLTPLELVGVEKKFDAEISLAGGGKMAQADASSLAIARALVIGDPAAKTVLKKQKLLTRDARKKERKKPGLKRARRAPQWQKR